MKPTTKKKGEVRRVKAWAVFIDGKIARWSSDLKEFPNPLIQGSLIIHPKKKFTNLVPVTITYTLPTKKIKK